MSGDHAKQSGPFGNAPIYSLLALVVFVVSATAMVLAGKADSGLFLGMVVTTIPSLVAALSAERAARDIRNGTVADKARQGAHDAIREAGVLTETGPVTEVQVEALRTLLGDIRTEAQRKAEEGR